jgi:hypothetical protein
MTTFVAIYRGQTISSARLIALSADPALVSDVSTRLLQERSAEIADPVIQSVERGRTAALRLIKRESRDARA